MNKRIYFKDTPVAHEMEDYANDQLKKVELFLENEPSPVFIDLTFSPSKVREHHKVELRIKTPNYNLISEYEHQGDDMYETLNRVIDTMYRRLREEKEKRIDERKHGEPKGTIKKD